MFTERFTLATRRRLLTASFVSLLLVSVAIPLSTGQVASNADKPNPQQGKKKVRAPRKPSAGTARVVTEVGGEMPKPCKGNPLKRAVRVDSDQ